MEVKPGYKQTEVGVIPEDWEVTLVGHEFQIQLGKMLDAEKNIGIPKPYIGNRAVQWGRIDLSAIGTVPMSSNDLSRYRLKVGDILVCEGGEVGRAAIWNGELEECYFQKALHCLRPRGQFNRNLMMYVLNRFSSSGFLINFVTQTSIAHLPKDKFVTVPLPLPPTLAEQEAIAEVLSDADALIESLEQLIAKKRHIKQGAMQELLTGKRRLPEFEVKPGYKQTEVGVIPEDWTSTVVREIASPVRNAIVGGPFGSDLVSKDYVEEGVPVIRGQNMGSKYVSGTFAFVTQAKARSLEGNLARANDLLFTQRGTLGQVSLVPTQPHDSYLISQSQMKLTVDGRRANPLFYYYVFSSSEQQEFIRQNTIQTGVPHINLGILREIPVQHPRLDEQTAIATILSDMDAEIDTLETKLAKARQIKQGMMQELLTGRIRLV